MVETIVAKGTKTENGELNFRALHAQLVVTKAVTTKVILLKKKSDNKSD